MCGIVISAVWHSDDVARDESDPGYRRFYALKERLQAANAKRGPDAQRGHVIDISAPGGRCLSLECYSSELLLRGDAFIAQPHIDSETGDVLCWNGEIFEGLDVSVHENDGAKLFAALRDLADPAQIPLLFGKIEGPYAFAYYHQASKKLFFARDPLGRRSLLIHHPHKDNPYFFLASSSVGGEAGYSFAELDTQYFYEIGLSGLLATSDLSDDFDRHLKQHPRLAEPVNELRFALPPRIYRNLPPTAEGPSICTLDEIPGSLVSAVDGLISHLDRSVRLRAENIPKRGSLAGTLQEARLAVLFSGGIDSTMLAFLANRHVPVDEPIDLLNVAFENPRKTQVKHQLENGSNLPRRQRRAMEMAAQNSVDAEKNGGTADYKVPDRETGLKQVAELRSLCPGRRWNFVEINVPYEESQAAREEILAAMWPCNTVMDFSLAIALYFAARGSGQVRDEPSGPFFPYESPAKVLLNGLGSDELLGGYGRHRATYKSGGWEGLIDELQLEIDRIPTRNMGRDDRMISSHGKETRHPFLSLEVVSFLASLPVNFKMDPRLEIGLGDKMLLRLAARKLGLIGASSRKKRAMQFGTHSARMESGIAPYAGGESLIKQVA